MNSSYIQTILDDTIKTVSVRFQNNSKTYTYKTRMDLIPGDFVIVKTHNGLSIVRVVELHNVPNIPQNSDIEFKWVTQKVDAGAIESAEEADKEFHDRYQEEVRRKHRESAKAELVDKLGEEFLGLK